MRKLSSADRTALIKLAASLPVGSPERRAILAGLEKEIKADADPNSHDQNKPETYYSKKASGDARNVTAKIVKAMAQDNGVPVSHFPRTNISAIEKAIGKMIAEGAVFDDEAIDMIAAGDSDEMEDTFGIYPSYRAVSELLDSLMEGPFERTASFKSKKASDPRPGKYQVTRERDGGVSKDLGLMDLRILSEELSEADSGNSKMIRKYGEGDTITIHDPANPDVLWTWIGDGEWELL